MSGEFLELEEQEILEHQENMKEQELSETEKLEARAAAYWDNYTEACGRGDKAAAKYYLDRYTQTRESLTSEVEEKGEEDLGLRLGKTEAEEAEEERKAREKVDAERERLERKLRTAEMNLEHAQKALDTLLHNKMDGMIGVDPNISHREYQVKVYTKDIANIKRDLANLKY